MPVEPAEEAPSYPDTVVVDRHRLASLEAAQRELGPTLKVLAVISERLLAQTGGEKLVISDQAFSQAPSIRAWRDEEASQVVVTVTR